MRFLMQFRQVNSEQEVNAFAIQIIAEGVPKHPWAVTKHMVKTRNVRLFGNLARLAILFGAAKTARMLRIRAPRLERSAVRAHAAAQSAVAGLDVDGFVDEVSLEGKSYKLHHVDVSSASAIFGSNQYGLTREVVQGKIFVDVGANKGLVSIYAAALGAKKVHAFEPIPGTMDILKQNVKANRLRNVKFYQTAVGDTKGSLAMHFDAAGDQAATSMQGHGANTLTVPLTTIDAEGLGKIGFLKIDAEGSEAAVLRGAAQTIRKSKPFIVMAAYHKPGDEQSLPALVQSIVPGYRCVLKQFPERDLFCFPPK